MHCASFESTDTLCTAFRNCTVVVQRHRTAKILLSNFLLRNQALPCLLWLVTGLSLLRPMFIARLVYVAFMVDRVFSGYLSVLLSVLFHQCSMFINSSMIDTIKILSEFKFFFGLLLLIMYF